MAMGQQSNLRSSSLNVFTSSPTAMRNKLERLALASFFPASLIFESG
jgi:hypothetical protein